tara:strand:- start:166 stop:366 length:201 start_codon:yes stop_codon:yes gene_type:complete
MREGEAAARGSLQMQHFAKKGEWNVCENACARFLDVGIRFVWGAFEDVVQLGRDHFALALAAALWH